MKVKEKICPEMYTFEGENIIIKSVRYEYSCPKCGMGFSYKGINFSDLKHCFNCGIKLDGMDKTKIGHLIKPIKIKAEDLFYGFGYINIKGTNFQYSKTKDIREVGKV